MRSLFFFSPIIWSLQRGFYNFIVAAIRLSHVVRRGRCNKRLVIHRKRVKNTPSISFSFLFDVQRYGFSISVYGLIPSFCSNWEAAKIWIWFTDTCCHFLQYLCSNRECMPKKGKNKKGWGEIAKAQSIAPRVDWFVMTKVFLLLHVHTARDPTTARGLTSCVSGCAAFILARLPLGQALLSPGAHAPSSPVRD